MVSVMVMVMSRRTFGILALQGTLVINPSGRRLVFDAGPGKQRSQMLLSLR